MFPSATPTASPSPSRPKWQDLLNGLLGCSASPLQAGNNPTSGAGTSSAGSTTTSAKNSGRSCSCSLCCNARGTSGATTVLSGSNVATPSSSATTMHHAHVDCVAAATERQRQHPQDHQDRRQEQQQQQQQQQQQERPCLGHGFLGGPFSETCRICLQSLPPRCAQPVSDYTLPCKHRMHLACAATWLAQSNSCPVCGRTVSDAARSMLTRDFVGPPSLSLASEHSQHYIGGGCSELSNNNHNNNIGTLGWIASAVWLVVAFAVCLALMDALQLMS